MKVKLTRREPTSDAAPDDATKALEGLVKAAGLLRCDCQDRKCSEADIEVDHCHCPSCMTYWFAQQVIKTPEGAALIRQAEERDDG